MRSFRRTRSEPGRRHARAQDARQPCGVLDRRQDPFAALIVAEQRQRRQQHRDREQQVLHAWIERLEPQPEVDAEAAVNPDDQQQNRLQRRRARASLTQKFTQFLRISLLESRIGSARRACRSRDWSAGMEWRGQGRVGSPRARVKRNRRRSKSAQKPRLIWVQKRSIEDRPARQRLPDRWSARPLSIALDRNVAERMIGEMQRHIDKKQEPGREPDLAKARHCGSICAIAAN